MEIVIGSTYLVWMEDFGLIGVFCSLVLQMMKIKMTSNLPSVCNSVQQNITMRKLKRQIFC
jgi:hypothetical protein